MNKEDQIREDILKILYENYINAQNENQMLMNTTGIIHSLSSKNYLNNEIMRNIIYLISSGYILKGSKRSSSGALSKDWYYPSDKTINYFDGVSAFQNTDKSYSGINIQNIKGNIVIGNNNEIINNEYNELNNLLDLLSEKIRIHNSISDENKLNYVSDIHTIQAQLSKIKPDKNIIKTIWDKLINLKEIAELSIVFNQIYNFIKGLGIL